MNETPEPSEPGDPAGPLLPQSAALAEASVDSLTEVFSKNPADFTPDDIRRMVAKLREQRARFEAAEKAKPQRGAKLALTPASAKSKPQTPTTQVTV